MANRDRKCGFEFIIMSIKLCGQYGAENRLFLLKMMGFVRCFVQNVFQILHKSWAAKNIWTLLCWHFPFLYLLHQTTTGIFFKKLLFFFLIILLLVPVVCYTLTLTSSNDLSDLRICIIFTSAHQSLKLLMFSRSDFYPTELN